MASVTMYDNTSLYEVTGGKKQQRQKLLEPLLWAKEHLLPRHSLQITVQLKKLDDAYCGFCIMNDDNNNRPREFIIELNKQYDDDVLLSTLMHEMVHVKQYVRNELQIRYQPTVHRRWFGEPIDEEMAYEEMPWELEAFSVGAEMEEEYGRV